MSNPAQHTKWHKCVDAMREIVSLKPYLRSNHRGTEAVRRTQEFAELILKREEILEAPVFVTRPIHIDKSGGMFFANPSDHDDYESMVDATEMLPWPFDRFILEITYDQDSSQFLIVEKVGDAHLSLACVYYFAPGKHAVYIGATGEPCSVHLNRPVKMHYNKGFQAITDDPEASVKDEFSASLNSLRRLFLQLATKGVVQDRIEAPERLNKQRMKKSKSAIPTVIRLRPGHYYDQDGERCEYDERKPVRIHWRRGHVRHVWCGVGDERRREPRYISPCLVNYDGGATPDYKTYTTH